MSSGRVDVAETLAEVFSSYARRGEGRGGEERSGEDSSSEEILHNTARNSARKRVFPPPVPVTTHASSSQRSRDTFTDAEQARVEDVWRSTKRSLAAESRQKTEEKLRIFAEKKAQEHSEESMRDGLRRQLLEEKDRSRFLELQLAERTGDNERLRLLYSETLTKLTESLKVVEEKASVNAELSNTIGILQQTVANMTTENTRLIEERDTVVARSLDAMQAAAQRDTTAEEEINKLRAEVSDLQAKLESSDAKSSGCIAQLEMAAADLQAAADRNHAIAKELVEEKARVRELMDEQQQHLHTKSAIAHARHDAARLVRLLQSTQEYKNFAVRTFPMAARGAADPSEGVDSTFIGSIPPTFSQGNPTNAPSARNKTSNAGKSARGAAETGGGGFLGGQISFGDVPRLAKIYCQFNDRSDFPEVISSRPKAAAINKGQAPMSSRALATARSKAVRQMGPVTDEHGTWVPSEVVDHLVDLRLKNPELGHVLTPEMARDLLLKLSSLWQKRFDAVAENIEGRYKDELSSLRRRVNFQDPYREVMQASTIARLSSQLHALRDAYGIGTGGAGVTTVSSFPAVGTGLESRVERAVEAQRSPSADSYAPKGVAYSFSRTSRHGHGPVFADDEYVEQQIGSPWLPPALKRSASAGRPHSLSPARITEILSHTGSFSAASPQRRSATPRARTLSVERAGVSLLSMPGSGAQRLDAVETAKLLEQSLAAVQDLSGRIAGLEADNDRLHKELQRSRHHAARQIAGTKKQHVRIAESGAGLDLSDSLSDTFLDDAEDSSDASSLLNGDFPVTRTLEHAQILQVVENLLQTVLNAETSYRGELLNLFGDLRQHLGTAIESLMKIAGQTSQIRQAASTVANCALALLNHNNPSAALGDTETLEEAASLLDKTFPDVFSGAEALSGDLSRVASIEQRLRSTVNDMLADLKTRALIAAEEVGVSSHAEAAAAVQTGGAASARSEPQHGPAHPAVPHLALNGHTLNGITLSVARPSPRST